MLWLSSRDDSPITAVVELQPGEVLPTVPTAPVPGGLPGPVGRSGEARSFQEFEADHLAVFPIEHDVGLHAFGRIDRDTVPAERQTAHPSEIDIRRIQVGIVGNLHVPIMHKSCRAAR